MTGGYLCPTCGLHPTDYACAVEARRDAIRTARDEADVIRLRALHRAPWTGSDARQFLTMLAARDGLEWVEGGRKDEPADRPSSPEQPCERCGEPFSPRNVRSRYCGRSCARTAWRKRNKAAAGRVSAA